MSNTYLARAMCLKGCVFTAARMVTRRANAKGCLLDESKGIFWNKTRGDKNAAVDAPRVNEGREFRTV